MGFWQKAIVILAVIILIIILALFFLEKMRALLHRAIEDNKFKTLTIAKRGQKRDERPRKLQQFGEVYLPILEKIYGKDEINDAYSRAREVLLNAYQALENGVVVELESSDESVRAFFNYLKSLIARNKKLADLAPKFRFVKIHKQVLSRIWLHETQPTLEFQFALEAYIHSERENIAHKKQLKNSIIFKRNKQKIWVPLNLKVEHWTTPWEEG